MNSTDETGTYMATKATPPIAVSVANTFSGMTLPEVVNWATLVYLLLLISHKGWAMHKEWKTGKDAHASGE